MNKNIEACNQLINSPDMTSVNIEIVIGLKKSILLQAKEEPLSVTMVYGMLFNRQIDTYNNVLYGIDHSVDELKTYIINCQGAAGARLDKYDGEHLAYKGHWLIKAMSGYPRHLVDSDMESKLKDLL